MHCTALNHYSHKKIVLGVMFSMDWLYIAITIENEKSVLRLYRKKQIFSHFLIIKLS